MTKKKRIKLECLLEKDTLTTLHNRFSLYHTLRELLLSVSEKDILSVIIIDIDRFSHLNQRLGQKYGDDVLEKIATRLKKLVKKEEHLARFGNDEFVVIFKKNEGMTLPRYLMLIDNLIKKPLKIHGETVYLSASIGVSIFPEHSQDADTLIELARVALLTSKDLGGNQSHIYASHMPSLNKADLELEAEVAQALMKDQFKIYYQPIFSISRNKVVGFEALIRWMHPTRGILLPSDFLTFCEETNLIIPIGEWVLHKACEQMEEWHRSGFSDLTLSINISARQLYYPGFLDFVTAFLKTSGLAPRFLEFEVTETVIMKNPDMVIPILKALSDMGVQLSLDDFGTGYSSLTYLKKFPFGSIKIDKSFIGEMCQSTKDVAIVDTIMTLGKSLGLDVVAEGVETQEQVTLLKAKNCDFLQGYFYSKPMPSNKVLNFLGSPC